MAQTDIETVKKLPIHDISEQINNVLTNFVNCLLKNLKTIEEVYRKIVGDSEVYA